VLKDSLQVNKPDLTYYFGRGMTLKNSDKHIIYAMIATCPRPILKIISQAA
jgi:hypothetical protein